MATTCGIGSAGSRIDENETARYCGYIRPRIDRIRGGNRAIVIQPVSFIEECCPIRGTGPSKSRLAYHGHCKNGENKQLFLYLHNVPSSPCFFSSILPSRYSAGTVATQKPEFRLTSYYARDQASTVQPCSKGLHVHVVEWDSGTTQCNAFPYRGEAFSTLLSLFISC